MEDSGRVATPVFTLLNPVVVHFKNCFTLQRWQRVNVAEICYRKTFFNNIIAMQSRIYMSLESRISKTYKKCITLTLRMQRNIDAIINQIINVLLYFHMTL